jgi:L-fucose/D-arabinose isomerase
MRDRRRLVANVKNIKTAGPTYRLRGDLPRIGIRPCIDGRMMGVRESLEDQTMQMAQRAAALISEHLRHPSGHPVECVIADSCIGGVAEAALCQDKFEKEQVAVTLTVSPCWCYGSETMDMDPLTVKAVWGFNGTERPGAVFLAAVLAAHSQKGLPAFGIYGRDVQDSDDTQITADVQEKILRFARAGLAVAHMRGKSYLSIGGCSMGIAGSIVDQDVLQSYLGMRTEVVDMSEIARRVEQEIYDRDEFELARAWVKDNCTEQADLYNTDDKKRTREQLDADWDYVIKMVMIGRDLMIGNPKLARIGWGEEALGRNAIAAGFQGQRSWTDFMPNGDFMETMLNSSFDWNGIRQAFVFATENDSLNGISMLFGHLLTGTSQIFSDVRTYWSPEAITRVTGWKPEGLAAHGFIHLINSGSTTLDAAGEMTDAAGNPAIKPYWEITPEDVEKTLDAVEFCPADAGYFRGGGYSSDFLSKGGMPVTMSRLNIVKGLGPVMQIAEGWTVDVPAEVHDKLDLRTNPTWPTTWFVPRVDGSDGAFKDVYEVMANWGANHGAVSYGHIGADLITLCAMLRIPVNMHNVAADDIFRPSYWNAFGMGREGSDYRACEALGPMYGRR